MGWIPKREYEQFLKDLDPELIALGAGVTHWEDHPLAHQCVLVGIVTFPSGLAFETCPGIAERLLCLWDEMIVPFRNFKRVWHRVRRQADLYCYAARANEARQLIEVWGKNYGQHYHIRFENDRIVDVTAVKEKGG